MISVEQIIPLLAGFSNRVNGHKFSFHFLLELVKEVVEAVEQVYCLSREGNSKEKKQIALDTIEHLYRQMGIDIPKIPVWLELWFVRTITSVIIDWLVSVYNEKKIFNHTRTVSEKT
ncbi:MAG: hypothetical protein N3A72_00070 [bacterium]|nr:hypothetical protein [bacterium]